MGIALTKHGQLGVSPVSSLANVVSLKFTFFSFGTWLIICNFVLLLGQILILRRNFKPIQLLQIPLSFLFGYFTDLGLLIIRNIPNNNYIYQILLVLSGIAVLGFGITLSVIADIILNSAEAFVKAISDVANKNFANVKIIFDILWVTFSILLSLIFFEGKLLGVREGTVISAVFVGFTVKIYKPLIENPLTKMLKK